MRAVLGFLFVLAGLIGAYIVIAGKVPTSLTTGSSTATEPAIGNTAQQTASRLANMNLATGMPSGTGNDIIASQGGMQ
jgi:hypothetical protein